MTGRALARLAFGSLAALALGACSSDPSAPPASATATATAIASPSPTEQTTASRTPATATATPQAGGPRAGVWLIAVANAAVHRLHEGEDAAFAAFGPGGDAVWLAMPGAGAGAAQSLRFSLDGVEQERVPGFHLGPPQPQRCLAVSDSPPAAEIDGTRYAVACGLFSPDGTKLLYSEGPQTSAPGATYAAFVLDLASGKSTLVNDDLRHCGGCDGRAGPAWSPTSRYVLVPELAQPDRVFLHDTATGETRVAAQGAPTGGFLVTQTGTAPGWSPVDDALVLPAPNGDVVIDRLPAGTRTVLPDAAWPARFTADARHVYSPSLASDGDTTTLLHDARTGELLARVPGIVSRNPFIEQLRVVGTADGPAALLERAPGCEGDTVHHPALPGGERCLDGFGAVFAPDGSRVAYARPASGEWSVVALDVATGIEQTLASGIPVDAAPGGSARPLVSWNDAGTHLLVEWPGYRGL